MTTHKIDPVKVREHTLDLDLVWHTIPSHFVGDNEGKELVYRPTTGVFGVYVGRGENRRAVLVTTNLADAVARYNDINEYEINA